MSGIELASTGLLMGIIHVLAGPDHLSALATLSGTNIRSNNNGYLESFLLGIKWGLGHAIGLIVVGAILISIEQSANNVGVAPAVATMLQAFVGVFMVALGIYGIHRARKHRSTQELPLSLSMSKFQRRDSLTNSLKMIEEHHDEDHHDDSTNPRCSIIGEMTRVLDEDSLHSSLHGSSRAKVDDIEEHDDVESRIFKAARAIGEGSKFMSSIITVPLNRLNSSFTSQGSIESNDDGGAKKPSALLLEKHGEMLEDFGGSKAEPASDADIAPLCCICTPGVLASLIGLVHGIAGPGGVLGIIPAVQLRDPYLASIYLGTFCFTSCIVMGCFAAFYGSFSKWLAGGEDSSTKRVFIVEVGSASLSLVVGFIWIILLGLGKLDELSR